MTSKEAFYDLLSRIRTTTNASGLEDEAGIPKGSLNKHYSWSDGNSKMYPMPPHHFFAVVFALCKIHGAIKIGNSVLTADEEINVIWSVTPIPGFPLKEKKIENEGRCYFKYTQQQYYSFYDEQDFNGSVWPDLQEMSPD